MGDTSTLYLEIYRSRYLKTNLSKHQLDKNSSALNSTSIIIRSNSKTQCRILVFLKIDIFNFRRSAAATGDGKGGQLITGGYKDSYISSSMRYNELGWSAGPELPEEKEYHCQVEVDDKVIVIGGRGRGDIATPLTYILEEDNWRQSEKMVTARDGHSCAVLNKNVYAIGGYSYWGGGYVISVEVFESETETWTAAPDLPYELAYAQAFVHDASVYVIGGYNGSVYNKNVLKLNDDGWDIVTEIEPMGDRSIFPALVLDENSFNCI